MAAPPLENSHEVIAWHRSKIAGAKSSAEWRGAQNGPNILREPPSFDSFELLMLKPVLLLGTKESNVRKGGVLGVPHIGFCLNIGKAPLRKKQGFPQAALGNTKGGTLKSAAIDLLEFCEFPNPKRRGSFIQR